MTNTVNLSYATDIRPLFREGDINCMASFGVKLDDATWMTVPENATKVYNALSSGKMPPDAPWSADKLTTLKTWIDAGCQA